MSYFPPPFRIAHSQKTTFAFCATVLSNIHSLSYRPSRRICRSQNEAQCTTYVRPTPSPAAAPMCSSTHHHRTPTRRTAPRAQIFPINELIRTNLVRSLLHLHLNSGPDEPKTTRGSGNSPRQELWCLLGLDQTKSNGGLDTAEERHRQCKYCALEGCGR